MSENMNPFGPGGWTPSNLPRLEGKTFVVTGANSGLGRETTKFLAAQGGRVLMLCRNRVKGEAAITGLKAALGADVDLTLIDLQLDDLESVETAAQAVRDRVGVIDGLIANAGIMMVPDRRLTRQGHEFQFGVNHLGHFALCARLADLVEPTAGRFVIVSSIAHNWGLKRINFEDLNFDKGYSPTKAYGQSKLANLLFMRMLDKRLRAAGSGQKAIACQPGYSATNLQTTGPGMVSAFFMKWLLNPIMAQPAEHGCWSTVLSAVEPKALSGEFYGPIGFMNMGGIVGQSAIAPHGEDDDAAARLWEYSEQATGVSWP